MHNWWYVPTLKWSSFVLTYSHKIAKIAEACRRIHYGIVKFFAINVQLIGIKYNLIGIFWWWGGYFYHFACQTVDYLHKNGWILCNICLLLIWFALYKHANMLTLAFDHDYMH